MGFNSGFKGLRENRDESEAFGKKTLVVQVVNTLQMTGYVSYVLDKVFSVALRLNAGHGLLILEVSISHTTTHHRQ